MDFIDFDSFQQDDIPQPQPAMSLPISSNIETLGKKISNFNSLTKNLLNFEEEKDTLPGSNETEENKLAEKYANLSLSLIDSLEDGGEGNANSTSKSKTTSTLSTRLSRVLNNTMPDSMIRDIFSSLDVKISNIEELVEPGITGSNSRKKLRSEVESDLIRTQSLIIKEYQPVIKSLSSLENDLQSLKTLTNSISTKINKDFQFTNELNDEVRKLSDQKKVLNIKKNLLVNFKNKFTLDVYEEYVLQNGEIDDEFFKVLVKCEKIHENCSILLSMDNPQLGLKIMNKFNQLINKSLERIINFTNKTLSNLYSLNATSKLETLRKCLKFLRKRLNYFNTVVDNFVDSRSKLIIDEFLNQVNGNLDKSNNNRVGSDQSSRPIFLSAHDPVRFIGDLLAYIHSVVVNETEIISSIFSIAEDGNDSDEINEYESIIDDVTGKILNSLSRSVKSKIDQIISSETKLSTIYSIYNLVELYTIMFAKHLKEFSNENQNLITTIKELVKSSQDKFISIIQNRLTTIKSSNSAQLELSTDLQPPEWIIDFYPDILPIIDQDSSETFMNLSEDDNIKFMNLIINQPIDILNEHIQNNISNIFNKRDKLILKLNFMDLILSKIMPVILLSDKIFEINDLVDKLSLELTDLQFKSLLSECQITDYYNVINMICPFSDDFFDVSIYQPILENKLFNNEKILDTNNAIQNFLPSALIDIQQSLFKLNSPMIVNNIITNSSTEFIKFYLKFNLIIKEYLDDIQLTWSDVEVSTLLGVEEPYLQIKPSINFD